MIKRKDILLSNWNQLVTELKITVSNEIAKQAWGEVTGIIAILSIA